MNKYLYIAFFAMTSFSAFGQGALENPAPNSTESGIGIISGWHCNASKVDAIIDGKSVGFGYVGSERGDATGICGKSNVGYSLLINFNNLPEGVHNLKIYADGVKFGESNFNTIKSGGVSFLQNVSKQVLVSDFPKTGSTATLTWSQSKQSFTVTGVANPITPVTPPVTSTGLERLYGVVTFNYRFTGSSTIYTDSARFTSANRSTDGQSLSANVFGSQYPIGCATLSSGFQFLCLIQSPSGNLDVFTFNVSSSNAISGTYEYCLASQTINSCVSDLVNTPDGTVVGVVNPSASSLSMNTVNSVQTGETKYQEKLVQIDKIESLELQLSLSAKNSETSEEVYLKLRDILKRR